MAGGIPVFITNLIGANNQTPDLITPIPISGTVTANQGTPNSIPNAWPTKITDGTDVLGVLAHPLRVDPTGTTIQPISGTVSINNFPATVAVTQSTTPWTVDGTVNALQSGLWDVSVNNFPAVQPVSGTVNAVPVDGTKATYSASSGAIGTALLATDIWTIYGSGTKTIRITRISIIGTRGANSNTTYSLIKRSTANTGGTSTTATAIPNDSNSAAATASVKVYTANPTLGTTVGTIINDIAFMNVVGTGVSDYRVYTFGNRPAQAIVLRGTGEGLAVNLLGVTVATSAIYINVEWEEE